MRFGRVFSTAILAISVSASAVFGAGLQQLSSGNAASGWEAVGRLDVAGGRSFCTATLIAADLVLTAGHCLYHPRTHKQLRVSDLTFRAGLRRGVSAVDVRAAAFAVHPKFKFNARTGSGNVAYDLALIRLAQPVTHARIHPFATATAQPGSGRSVGVVSYARKRSETASLEQGCNVLDRRSRVLLMDCRVDFGASGAPVFAMGADGRPQIVSVISAAARMSGRNVALGTDLQQPLSTLKAMIARAPRQAAALSATSEDAAFIGSFARQ